MTDMPTPMNDDDFERRLAGRYRLLSGICALLFLFSVIGLIVHDSRREWKTYQKTYARLAGKQTGPKLHSALIPLLAEEIPEDLHFAATPAFEYCLTCHQGCGETPGPLVSPNPYKPHPQDSLYTGSGSPHPAERFGCVVCHGGHGVAVSFRSAGHFKMLPLTYTQASCLDCHRNNIRVPQAPLLSRGRELYYQNGCAGCHSMAYADSLPRTGPPLRGINRKVSPAWVNAWIASPEKVKPGTRMPSFFDPARARTPGENLEIAGITEFLFNDSLPPLPVSPLRERGDTARGRQLFQEVGCTGCHSVVPGERPAVSNLAGSGNKLGAQWLEAWLKKPAACSPSGVLMPDFRLTQGERADIAAFLLDRKEGPSPAPVFSPVHGKDLRQAGEKAVRFYGCYGCHLIKGMENEALPGGTLDDEGDKRIEDFDFGALKGKIPLQKWSYFEQVLDNPRAFDTGLKKSRASRRRMPIFALSSEDKKALACLLLAERQSGALPSIRVASTSRDSAFNRGDEMLLSRNCRGCHTLFRFGEALTADIRASIKDTTLLPPSLYLEGKKVKESWTYSFLDSVFIVRPWLKVRMPSFGFSADTLDRIIKHFAAEAGPQGKEAYFDPARVSPKSIALGKKLFTDFKCQTCHVKKGFTPDRPRDQWAPDIALTPQRMRVEWCVLWLQNPQKYVPGTRMPDYFYDWDEEGRPAAIIPDADKALLAIRDYMFTQLK